MSDLLRALKEDALRMEDIAADCGRVLREPYIGDQNRIERYLWAIAVAVLHLLLEAIKRKDGANG